MAEAQPAVARSEVPGTSFLHGVGPVLAAKLAAQGIVTVADLIKFFPRRSDDVLELARPEQHALGRLVRLAGRVERATLQWLPGRRSLVAVTFAAPDGTAFQASFFNQPYLKKSYVPGLQRIVEGVLDRRGKGFVLRQPRVLQQKNVAPGPVVMRYPELVGVSEARLRALLLQAFTRVDLASIPVDALPAALAHDLPPFAAALRAMHFPSSREEHERARQRFALHEAVALFRRVEKAQRRRAARQGPSIGVDAALRARIAARIPFALTEDQRLAVTLLKARLAGPAPMGVLLQGDVGTGKTAVALWIALAALAHGWQVAFLAPTELLAEQNARVARAWLDGSKVRITVLTAASRERELSGAQLVFGTHALFSASTRFARLGLVIVDEQHRFGVAQRMRLVGKGEDPHVLVMTATPIPRTLALTLFGDLEIVTLRARPPGQRPVRALVLDRKEWPRVLAVIARHVARSEQVYVVCPQVGVDGEKGGVVRMHEELARRFRCALVHGEQRSDEREKALARFRARGCDVLVGTTVLEVGVDVAGATLMVVVQAERFGLATLHQLRGRVGRGKKRGVCLLVGERNARTAAVAGTTDGFALAEEDLRLRGAGELMGTRQSGAFDLRALDPVEDLELLLRARAAVREGETSS